MESVTVYRGDEDGRQKKKIFAICQKFSLDRQNGGRGKSLCLNSKKEIDSPAALT
jgi:hypothetical protein